MKIKNDETKNIVGDIFFEKKNVVTFFLSVLVLLGHIHSFDGYEYVGYAGKILYYFGRLMTFGMQGVHIRLFFVISGALFFRNYSYGVTLKKYKSRVKSLVIPYLIWCTFYTIILLALGYTPFGNMIAFDTSLSLKNLLMGIFLNKYYNSFWFVFNLIVFALFCPVIYALLKNKYIGATILVVISVLYGMGIKIPENVIISGTEYTLFWRADSIIFYMIGAYVGIHFFEWLSTPKGKKESILGLIGFVACSLYRVFAAEFELPNTGITHIIFMVIFCLATWVMFDYWKLSGRKVEIYNYSFMMFALNWYLGVYISKVLFQILPKSQIFCLINFAITVIIECVVIWGISYMLKKKVPRFYAVITGGR